MANPILRIGTLSSSPFLHCVKAVRKTDKRGHQYCVEQGVGKVSCATGSPHPQNPVVTPPAAAQKESEKIEPITRQEQIAPTAATLAKEGLLPSQIANAIRSRISSKDRMKLDWIDTCAEVYIREKLGPLTKTLEQAQKQWEGLPVFHAEDPLPKSLLGSSPSSSMDYPIMLVRVKDYRDHPPTDDEGYDHPRSKAAVAMYMERISQNDFEPPEVIGMRKGGVRMGDGWHRFTAAYLLGLEYIPAFVQPKQKKE